MYLVKQGGKIDYNYKEYYLDNQNELSSVLTSSCCPGSVAYIIDTQKVYILNANKQWIEQ